MTPRRIFGGHEDLNWWLRVRCCPATMAAMGALGVLSLIHRPGYLPRHVPCSARQGITDDLEAAHRSLTAWADGDTGAAARAMAALERLNSRRGPIYAATVWGTPWREAKTQAPYDARSFSPGDRVDEHGFPARSSGAMQAAGNVVLLPTRRPRSTPDDEGGPQGGAPLGAA